MRFLLSSILGVLLLVASAGAQTFEFSHPQPTNSNFNDAILLPNGDYLLLGDGSAIARSTDNGMTWALSFPDSQRRDIYEATFVDGNTGYLAGTLGLLMKSTDGGQTWFDLPAPVSTTWWYLDFIDADTGIVVGNSSNIIKTTDGGATWSQQTLSPATTLYKVHYVNPSTIYIGTSNATLGRLLRSTDYGATWANVAGYTGTGTTRGLFFLDADTGWVTNSDYVFFKTTDGGTTFANQGDFGTGSIYEVKFTDPQNGVGVGASGDVFFTTNGGTTWDSTYMGLESNVFGLGMEGLLSRGGGLPTILVGGVNGAVATTTDWGATWNTLTRLVTQEDLREVEFLTDQVGYAVGGSATPADSLGEILHTSDGGQTWDKLAYNPRHRGYSMDWVDANTMSLATRGPDGIFRTTDGGVTFTQQTPGIMTSTGIWYKIRFADASTGYAAGASGVMVKTTDGGATWNEVTDGHGTSTIYSMYVFDANNLITIGASSKVYATTDGGTTWTPQTIPGTSTTLYDVTFVDQNLGFICGTTGRVYRTTDHGTTWTQMTTPSTTTMYSVVFADADTGWVVGTGGAMFKTTDGGTTWSLMQSIADKILYSASIKAGNLWVAGAAGTIIRAPIGGGGPGPAFFDDFESGTGNWTLQGTWGTTELQSHSPTHSLTESPTGNYGDNLDISATLTNGIDLSAALDATLSFWARYDVEEGFDYMYVDVSTNGGATWNTVDSFDGTDATFQQYTYSLGGFVGHDSVKIRFHFVSDGGFNLDGMYIDDVMVTTSNIDQTPPLIVHTGPLYYQGTIAPYALQADIVDVSGVASASVVYTVDGGSAQTVSPDSTGGSTYYFTIPAAGAGAQVDYHLTATDNAANTGSTETSSYIAGIHLVYDNGQVDFVNSFAANTGAAVRVTMPQNVTGRLVTALIRNYTDVNRPNDSMLVHIWGANGTVPGTDLITPFKVFPEATLSNTSPMTRVDLRPYAAQLSGLSGDVFIGFTVPASSTVWLTQRTPGVSARTLTFNGTTWTAITDDYHFRAVIGDTVTVGVVDNAPELPTVYALDQNYPNPFNPTTTIRYSLPRESMVTLKVYNLLGQEVATLVEGVTGAGFRSVVWNGTNRSGSPVASGLYFYRIDARAADGSGAFTDLKKMLFVK